MIPVVLRSWTRFHQRGWHIRWPLKSLAVLFVIGLALYPRVWLVPTWVGRLADMNRTLEPEHPWIAELAETVRARGPLDNGTPLATVQQVVYEHVPYAHDWEVWGVMDYLPTVDEVRAAGREDCDGQAVVAASVLRALGHDASLVSNLLHTWVVTPAGETMSPSVGEKSLTATKEGTRSQFSLGLVHNLLRGVRYGIKEFPLSRQLAIVIAVLAATLHPRQRPRWSVVGMLVALLGYALARTTAGLAPPEDPAPLAFLIGLIGVPLGWLLIAARAGGRRCVPLPAG